MAYDFPASPTTGQAYNGFTWNGYAWIMDGIATPIAPVSDAPPPNPSNGQLWWESDSGNLYVWYVDVNSSQWVQINGPGLGDAPADGKSYSRRNNVWTPETAVGAASGYITHPSGIIQQWVYATSAGAGGINVTWPIPFPTACVNVQTTPVFSGGAGVVIITAVIAGTVTTTGCTVQRRYNNGAAIADASEPMYVFATGY